MDILHPRDSYVGRVSVNEGRMLKLELLQL